MKKNTLKKHLPEIIETAKKTKEWGFNFITGKIDIFDEDGESDRETDGESDKEIDGETNGESKESNSDSSDRVAPGLAK